MRNVSYEQLLKQIQKNINLVCAYLQDNNFDFIIKSCRLKPISIFEKKFNNNLKLDNVWFDEFGNTIHITNNTATIVYKDKGLKDKIISSDMLIGRNIKEISKSSNIIYIFYSDNFSCVSFLGNDSYLRTFLYENNKWIPTSSLILGLNTLRLINRNLHINNFAQINLQQDNNILLKSCTESIEWLSCWPAQENFLSELKQIDIFKNLIGD
jgi:hypothetical protein